MIKAPRTDALIHMTALALTSAHAALHPKPASIGLAMIVYGARGCSPLA